MDTTKEKLPVLADMPPVPDGSAFELRKIERISLPHPYCIGVPHVVHASDHFGGMLTADAIRDAERHGASCDICRRSGKPVLSYDEHETSVTLFIALEDNEHLNNDANQPVRAYLCDNKKRFIATGIDGFAFLKL